MNDKMENHGGILGEPGATQGPGPHILAADTLAGEKVVNEAGESLGEITHIMLNITEGSIAYAVLSFGSLLGMGGKLFAVPWHALALDVENRRFVLNVDKERLKNAPGFDRESWPAMANPKWASEVHSYYGPVTPSRRPFI